MLKKSAFWRKKWIYKDDIYRKNYKKNKYIYYKKKDKYSVWVKC